MWIRARYVCASAICQTPPLSVFASPARCLRLPRLLRRLVGHQIRNPEGGDARARFSARSDSGSRASAGARTNEDATHYPRGRPASTAHRRGRSRTGRAGPANAARRRPCTGRNRRCRSRSRSVERTVSNGGLPRAVAAALRAVLCTRRSPPPASASRPSTCSRGDRRRNSRGRSLGQSPRHWRRGRGHRARRPARHPLEFLQLGLGDCPVHAPMPPFCPLLGKVILAEHVASTRGHAAALRTHTAPPSTSQTLRLIDRVRRKAKPLAVGGRRSRAWLDSRRRRIRGRNARGPASIVVLVACAARSWRGQPALRAPARWRLRLPRSAGVPVASAKLPAARPTPLARWLATRRLLPGGRTWRRRRRGRGAGSSAAAAAAAPRRPRRPRRTPDFMGPRARRAHIRKHVRPALNLLRMSKVPP